jgi:hypothetical protein
MEVRIDRRYYESISEDAPSALIGTFDRYYSSSRNYIADLEHLGPILISVAEDGNAMRTLVRSVLGFSEYRYFLRHIKGCRYFFCIKNSISHYFRDNIDNWGCAENNHNKRSAILGFINSIFNFSASWPLVDNSGGANSRRSMYESISVRMMKSPGSYMPEAIIKQLAEIPAEFAGELDREFQRRPIYIELVCGNGGGFPAEALGRRIHEDTGSLDVADHEIDGLEIAYREAERGLESAFKELVITELEYFELLSSFRSNGVERCRWLPNESFLAIFNDFLEIYGLEMRILSLMASVLKPLGIELGAVIEDVAAIRRTIKEVEELGSREDYDSLLMEMAVALEGLFGSLKAYEDLMLSYESSLALLSEIRRTHSSLPDDGRFIEGFSYCLQRIVKYPLLFKNIIRHSHPDNRNTRKYKEIYLKFRRLLARIDHRKMLLDNERCSRLAVEKIAGLDGSFVKEGRKFIDQMDCVSSSGVPMTLFLFSGLLLVTERDGPPGAILNPNSGRYMLLGTFPTESLELSAYGKSGLKIVNVDDIGEHSAFYSSMEIYSDASVGILYFLKCIPADRARFLENFTAASIGPGNLYVSHEMLFTKVLDRAADISGKSDMVVYAEDGFRPEYAMGLVGFLDRRRSVLEVYDEGGLRFSLPGSYGQKEFGDRLASFLINAAQAKRAFEATPLVFLKYKMGMKALVNKFADAPLVKFTEKLSPEDGIAVTIKLSRIRDAMGYLEHSLGRLRLSGAVYAESGRGAVYKRDGRSGKPELHMRILEGDRLEDELFSRHGTDDVLCAVMCLIRGNIYTFFNYRTIETLHSFLFKRSVRSIGLVLPYLEPRLQSFVSQFLTVVLMSRSWLTISPVIDVLRELFASYEVGEEELVLLLSSLTL